jgi:hypothetical protein
MRLKDIIKEALAQSISIDRYAEMLSSYAESGRTSGKQTEDLIYYTKLNAQRSKRIAKNVSINARLKEVIRQFDTSTKWLLITETWCGDAANSIPVIAKAVAENPEIELRVVFRDEQPELMDQFLTNGGRSIPKLIALNSWHEVLFTWGPRPKEAQELYDSWRFSDEKIKVPYSEFQVTLQKWYNQNAGEALQVELYHALKGIDTRNLDPKPN